MTYPLTWDNGDVTISIHTSAREVTDITGEFAPLTIISIHTSAREVTSAYTEIAKTANISIHTSAREVTIVE